MAKRNRLKIVKSIHRAIIRYQSRIVDTRGRTIPRTPASTAYGPQVEAAITEAMRRFRVSRSFVIATAVNTFFGIDAERYDDGE